MISNPEISKLDKMLHDGKISSDEYEELKKNLPKPSEPTGKKSLQDILSHHPWQVWVCSIVLFIVAVIDILTPPYHLGSVFAACLSGVLGWGLLKRNKIAYVITGIIGIVTILYCLNHIALWSSLFNLAYCIILASVWKYYFPRNAN